MFQFHFSVSKCKSLRFLFCTFPPLRFPSFTNQECSLIQGHIPMFSTSTIPLLHAHFHKKTWHQRDLGQICPCPWMCHEVEILSSCLQCFTLVRKKVKASGRLPSHPLSLHPSASWMVWLTHSKVQAKGFCCWIYSSFHKLSLFFSFFLNITWKGIGYVTHISTCCSIHCQQEAGSDKTRVLISHSVDVAPQVRAANIV